MIGALIQGGLASDSAQRTANSGSPFVTATMRVPVGAGALFIGIVTHATITAERLSDLRDGSIVDPSSTMEAFGWVSEARKGWRLIASKVLSSLQTLKRSDYHGSGE